MRVIPSIVSGLLILVTLTASAQNESNSKIFIKVIGGYAFLGPGSFSGIDRGAKNNFKASAQRFGQGLRGGLGIGLIINENINLGLDVVYHKGNQVVVKDAVEGQVEASGTQYTRTTNTSIEGRYNYSLLNFIPHIAFKAISKPNYYIYNRVGVIVSRPMAFDYEYQGTSSIRTQNVPPAPGYDYETKYTYDDKADYTSGLALGYQAALGVQFKVSENLRFFTELEASSLVLVPKELEYTQYKHVIQSTRTLPTPVASSTSTDSKLQHIFYQKNGQLKTDNTGTVTKTYTSQTKFATNSVALNIGIALRL